MPRLRGTLILGWFFALSQGGCVTLPPAAELEAASAGYAFSAGKGIQNFPFSPSLVLPAVHQAMADLDLKAVDLRRDGTVSRVESRTDDDRPVVATLRSHRGSTHVTVRIGWFGDEPLSRALLQRMEVRLGSRAPEAIPSSAPSAPSRNPYFSRDAVPDAEILRDFAEAPYRDRVIP